MRAAIAALVMAACYSPDHRDWTSLDAATSVRLTVTIMGSGQVTVDNVGTCAHPTCTFDVPARSTLMLQAAATNEDHPFDGWTQACTGKDDTCSVLVMSPTQVGAKFH